MKRVIHQKTYTNTPKPTPDPIQDEQRLPVKERYKTYVTYEGSPKERVTKTGLQLAKTKTNAGYQSHCYNVSMCIHLCNTQTSLFTCIVDLLLRRK